MKLKMVAVVLPVAAATLVAVLTPAAAAPARLAAPAAVVCNADVCLYRGVLRSVPRTPPLTTLIEFDTEALTTAYPQAWQANVLLKWWRSAKALHRARGRWVEVHPILSWHEVDLPGVGHHKRMPVLSWDGCEQGAYYVRLRVFGITHNGYHQSVVLYFPWARFKKGHPNKGNEHRPPSLRLAWHTKCQGSDGLQG